MYRSDASDYGFVILSQNLVSRSNPEGKIHFAAENEGDLQVFYLTFMEKKYKCIIMYFKKNFLRGSFYVKPCINFVKYCIK